MSGFLHATNWKVLYGINLGNNTVESAVDEAVYVSNSFGNQLYGFEIGNEPENFATRGISPPPYSPADYLAEWERFAKAIRARLPNVVLTGPASANLKYVNPFAADEASLASLLTLHYYRGRGINPTSTLAMLLAPNPALSTRLAGVRDSAVHMSRGYRVAECNSFSDGGVLGASDVFGSALWAIDFLFQLAQAQSTGANFEGGGFGDAKDDYAPLTDNGAGQVTSIRPIFYGIQLFSMMANGTLMNTQVTMPKTTAPNTTFSAYAVAQAKNTAVVLNNKDTVNSVSTTVVFGRSFQKVSTYLLTAPSLESITGVTFGGAPINPDGSWGPASDTVDSQLDHQVTVTVPPGSALLVRTE
jgi:hypothetical protein